MDERRIDMTKKKEKSQWEITTEQAEATWKAMTPEQRDSILRLAKAWVEIRTSYSELCSPSFSDICEMDNAFFALKRHLMSKTVESKDWSY